MQKAGFLLLALILRIGICLFVLKLESKPRKDVMGLSTSKHALLFARILKFKELGVTQLNEGSTTYGKPSFR